MIFQVKNLFQIQIFQFYFNKKLFLILYIFNRSIYQYYFRSIKSCNQLEKNLFHILKNFQIIQFYFNEKLTIFEIPTILKHYSQLSYRSREPSYLSHDFDQ